MKDEKNMIDSRKARLNQVIRHSIKIHGLANTEWCALRPSAERIAEMRELSQSILQAVHEYSAYSTALEDIAA